ncbi:MAG: hypothetical protein ACI8R4_001113 [Paracoccaceae bacterium]|jgi:hypothetical protein
MHLRSLFSAILFATLTMGMTPAHAASCLLDGSTVSDGQEQMFYQVRSVPRGQSCTALGQLRGCADGALNGAQSYRYDDCLELEEFLGVNTNRRPHQLDPALLARTNANWIRTNVEVLAYKEQFDSGVVDPDWKFADWDYYKAAAAGPDRKAILNLMWDFKRRDQHLPLPGSQQEADLFRYLDLHILDKLVPSVDILVTGNEPFVNTMDEDWQHNPAYGGIPIVVFYTRVTEHVHAYLLDRGLRDQVDLYMGAFTRLHTTKTQKQPGVRGLLAYAAVAAYVDGVDLHTHVTTVKQIDKALTFAREFTDKPIIVTEYTFVWRMQDALLEGEKLGAKFAGRWGRDPKQKIGDYMSCDVFGAGRGCKKNGPISKAEWDDFFATRDWFIDHFITQADAIFSQHAVRGATFGLVQTMPRKAQLSPENPPWYMGFLFSAVAVEPGPDGTPQANYQYYDDFLAVQKQRARVSVD